MLLAVIRCADNEKGTRSIGGVLARPRPVAIAKSNFNIQAVHKRGVEAKRSLEIGDAHENMRKHIGSFGQGRGSTRLWGGKVKREA